jgi:hypothetical protein
MDLQKRAHAMKSGRFTICIHGHGVFITEGPIELGGFIIPVH